MSFGTAKHELFATYLADGLSQEAAYVKAGFSPKGARGSASSLLKRNSNIFKRRDEILAERMRAKEAGTAAAIAEATEEFKLDAKTTLANVYRIYEMGTAAIPVLNSDGAPIGEYRTNLNSALAAMLALGKQMHGMFTDRQPSDRSPFAELTHEQRKTLRDKLLAEVEAEAAEEARHAVGSARNPHARRKANSHS